jgi:hypothetical protein
VEFGGWHHTLRRQINTACCNSLLSGKVDHEQRREERRHRKIERGIGIDAMGDSL